MEACCDERVNDIRVLSDQAAWSKFQSVERCKQWGVNAEDSFGSVHNVSDLDNSPADEGDFSCETWMDELEMDCQVGIEEDDELEMSDVRGGSMLESSKNWNAFLNNEDVRVDGFPRIIQTDENFVNSMLLDDVRIGEQYQCNYLIPNKMHDMERSYEHLESHQSLPETFVSVEETVLQELGNAMHKMTNNTRLCFRDALYRLATDSGKKSDTPCQNGDECASGKPSTTSLLDHLSVDASESQNKAIDITIADLMFNKPYQQQYDDDCHQELNPPQFRYNALISSNAEVPSLK